MLDIIIKNGVIIDGTGKSMFQGDLGITGDKIKIISNLKNEETRKIIDAEGCYVTPGLIDINNHSDTYWRIFSNPGLESLLFQGITSIIGGNCGSSLAPILNEDMFRSIQKWINIDSLNLNWSEIKEFLKEIKKISIATNFGTLVGHATVRRGIIGDSAREASSEEIKIILKIIEKALDQGALGVSLGLVYTHAQSASYKELSEVAKLVARKNKVLAVHLREESDKFLESLEEVLILALNTEVNLEISHLKVIGKKNWDKMERALEMISDYYKKGLRINFDVYPYTSTGSVLYSLLPKWVAEGGKKMMLERLRNNNTKLRVIAEMKKSNIDYSKIIISSSPLDKSLTRRKIVEIAKSQNKDVEEAIIDILLASGGRVIIIMEDLNEENIKKELIHPLSIIASNGSGYKESHKQTKELVHPRSFGSFPRILSKYVKQEKLLGWEEAIYKMSGYPARKYQILQRGILQKGNFADIVVWDPYSIEDLATNYDPYHYSEGVDYLLVNGNIVIEKGKYLGQRKGQIIKRK